ncbi:hypothetical protein, partial [Pseudescherichia sp.]|uniref:hypothetical protein n=1 Tax=Pseudescherichia sp. TaxID=2055881 RepID=UPI0028A8869C
ETGITIDGDATVVELTYTFSRITSFDNNMVTAEYTISMNGVSSGQTISRMFAYSGTGNPSDQAEPQLQAWLETLPGVVQDDGTVIQAVTDEADAATATEA